ncbi:MAG: FUSC family protein [Candidatus Binatia bacterium]|nr:FUSC family protein [Candidatus Binatia bacterium]
MFREIAGTLREELRYDSERARQAIQVTISVLLVVLVMLATQMPFIGIAPYMVFLLSQGESISTRAAAILASAVTLTACLLIVLITLIAFDAPWFRVPLFTLLFFGGFYLMRTFSQPKAVLGALVILGLALVAFDKVPTPTYLFTQLAWLVAVLGLVIAGSLLGGWVTRIPSGRERLRHVLVTRMMATEQTLRVSLNPQAGLRLAPLPGERIKVQETLERTILVGRLTARQGDHYAAIEQLWTDLDEACDASGRETTAIDRGSLARAVTSLRCAILEERALSECERRAVHTVGEGTYSPALRSAVQNLDRGWTRILMEGETIASSVKSPEMLPDDFGTNPLYASFALRATLATMGCYLLMVTTHWDGIHTSMVTTVVTALATTGAQVHKQALRISGAVVGGAVGIVMVTMVIPRYDSLIALLVIIGLGTLAAAWISLGSTRISYAGWQIALAFFMTVLQGAHPATNLDVIWDRWAGIAIGIFAMQLAFRIAWPQTTVEALRDQLQRIHGVIDAFARRDANSSDSGTGSPREIAAELVLAAEIMEEAGVEARFRKTDQVKLAKESRELCKMRSRFAAALADS